ncbi:MAG: aldehyde ferredoxin oxidoreductase C-terminal domain-containing protein, partial [Desulfatiglandales bacterium]
EWGEPGTQFPFYPPKDLVYELVEWQENMHYIDDGLGLCAGLSSFAYKPPYHIHNLPELIYYSTGLEYTEDELWKTAERIRNLVRANNVRRGLRRKDERPPEDHWKRRFPEYEEELLLGYYRYRGWNEEGIPTREKLLELGLHYVLEDFEGRGIL